MRWRQRRGFDSGLANTACRLPFVSGACAVLFVAMCSTGCREEPEDRKEGPSRSSGPTTRLSEADEETQKAVLEMIRLPQADIEVGQAAVVRLAGDAGYAAVVPLSIELQRAKLKVLVSDDGRFGPDAAVFMEPQWAETLVGSEITCRGTWSLVCQGPSEEYIRIRVPYEAGIIGVSAEELGEIDASTLDYGDD